MSTNSLKSSSSPARSDGKFYVASKTKHAAMWREKRSLGARITSSWIDEADVGQTASFAELWARIQRELIQSTALVLYVDLEDPPLKGALIEVGMALMLQHRVYLVTAKEHTRPELRATIGSWIEHPKVIHCGTDLPRALEEAKKYDVPPLPPKR